MKKFGFGFCAAVAAVTFMIPSAAQAVVMKTVYSGTVSPNSFGGAYFGIADQMDGLPFEMSIIWDRDDPLHLGQSGVLDGSGPGAIDYVTQPIKVTLKIASALRTFDQFTQDDYLSEFRSNEANNFGAGTQFSSGNFGLGTEFSCVLGVVLPGSYQPLFLSELYQITNATSADGRGQCGLLQAMAGVQFGLDATSLTVAPLVTPIPVPPAIPLLLTGMTALYGVRRRKK
jgi:hypothetical protein